MILAIGDSFTLGEELSDLSLAWPFLVDDNAKNLGRSGTSNDSMLRLAMENTIDKNWELVIVAWTHPARFECYNEKIQDLDTIMPNSRTGLPWCNDFFKYSYNEKHAYIRWFRQILLLQSWFKQRQQSYLFAMISEITIDKISYVPNSFWAHLDTSRYLGWPDKGFGEICKGTPLGANGHPLELGHQLISNEIRAHIGI